MAIIKIPAYSEGRAVLVVINKDIDYAKAHGMEVVTQEEYISHN